MTRCTIIMTICLSVVLCLADNNTDVTRIGTNQAPLLSDEIDYNCDDCKIFDHRVCISGRCYCEADYYKNTLDQCLFKLCTEGNECKQNGDNNRECSPEGKCVCKSSYWQEPTNGNHCGLSNDCTNCASSQNKVCIGNKCYCKLNYYQNSLDVCVYRACTNSTGCTNKGDINLECSPGNECVCGREYWQNTTNGGKCSRDNGCGDCLSSDNKVCFNNRCYCAPDYYKTSDDKCEYSRCSSDTQCEKNGDYGRECRNGSCVCRHELSARPSDGYECLLYSGTPGLYFWYWGWILIVVPTVVVVVSLAVYADRMRKRQMSARQVATAQTGLTPVSFTPSFVSQQYYGNQSFCHHGHPYPSQK